MRLFGTTTSPFVRRVRVVAAELGVPYELVDTATDEGQALLRERSPIRKVPTLEQDGRLVYDSHTITEHLLAAHGPGPLRSWDPNDLDARNTVSVIDGALDALINVLYLQRDGIGAEQSSYVVKQRERAGASFAWLEQRLIDGVWLSPPAPDDGSRRLSLIEIALVSTIDWVRFRDTYPIDRSFPALARCSDHHGARPSFAATLPHV